MSNGACSVCGIKGPWTSLCFLHEAAMLRAQREAAERRMQRALAHVRKFERKE